MHHNDINYWRYLVSLEKGNPDLPSPRVCKLMERMFQRWREKPLWPEETDMGHLFIDRDDLTISERTELAKLPIPIRKARALRRLFEIITDKKIAARTGSFSVDADELILGTLPPFSVGQGKEFVNYLTKDERLNAMLSYLSERSPMGHIVPDHGRVVTQGLRTLIGDCIERAKVADEKQRCFYQSVCESLEAIIFYAHQYADEAERVAAGLPKNDNRSASLLESAKRLRKVPEQKADTFIEAVQSIQLMHCALHWTVEIVPLGRLDQILFPLYEADIKAGILTRAEAQEILDCFWIKLGERAILNRRHLENRFTATDGVLTGTIGSSNYDQGGLLNQWMQQITIGGVIANSDEVATDACNEVTEMCLESSRRLPLNSPTLDLRVHAGTPPGILQLAARTLLSGGAHPVILNDDKIIAGLLEGSAGHADLATARNYACDGCYETMFAGESEFSFGFVSAPDAIEKAINRGAGIAGAGPSNLLGTKDSWRSKAANNITSWPEFLETMNEHILLGCHRYIHNLLLTYGNKADICPSPMLSALIGGCIEAGRDLADGGARYHIFSPLLTGISTAADSLYVIKTLVFEQKQFTLDELRTALTTDWGKGLIKTNEKDVPALGLAINNERIKEIRQLCNSQPKFGFGNRDVDELAWSLIDNFCDAVAQAWKSDTHRKGYEILREKYNCKDHPFHILLVPGVGTFEQYVFSGSFLGASADGRPSRSAIASDLSPAPVHSDLPVEPEDKTQRHARIGTLQNSFKSYAHGSMSRLGDGAPADYNLPEDFPVDKLTAQLKAFANGQGGSIATFTVGDPETLAAAKANPEAYNLVRVRMGGWSEFFVCLFPDHQEQHRRRPLFIS